MADQVPTVPAVESPPAVAVVSEQEMPPAPQEPMVQVPAPVPGPVRRRPRRRVTARKSVVRRRAYFQLNWRDEPLVFDPPSPTPAPAPVPVVESLAENSASEEEPMEMEPEKAEESTDDTAQSKFTLTFAKASDFPGPCPYGFCGWLDD